MDDSQIKRLIAEQAKRKGGHRGKRPIRPVHKKHQSRVSVKHKSSSVAPRNYEKDQGALSRYVKRMRRRYCYLKQYPNNEVSQTPLRDVFTYHEFNSRAGSLLEYTTLKKYHQHQHGSAHITMRHNFHTTNPRISSGFVDYFRQLLVKKYGLNSHDAQKLNTARVIYICMSLEADSDVQNIIADGFSVDGNQVMQKIQKERNDNVNSHTVRQTLSTLDHKLDSVIEGQSHSYEIQGKRFTRIKQMLYALGMFIVDIFSTMCASGAKHFGLMNGKDSIEGRLEGNKHRSFFKSGLIAAQHNLHSNSEVATRRHQQK